MPLEAGALVKHKADVVRTSVSASLLDAATERGQRQRAHRAPQAVVRGDAAVAVIERDRDDAALAHISSCLHKALRRPVMEAGSPSRCPPTPLRAVGNGCKARRGYLLPPHPPA